jgi:hypothetical protein
MSDPNDETNTPEQKAGFRLNPAALDKVRSIQQEVAEVTHCWVREPTFRERMLHGVAEHLAAKVLEAAFIATLGAGLVLLWDNAQASKGRSLSQREKECIESLLISKGNGRAQAPNRRRSFARVPCPVEGDIIRIRSAGK